jgi:hypothetical protein
MKWTLNVNNYVSAYRNLDGRILENVYVELDWYYLTILWWTWWGYGKQYHPWTCLVVLCNWNAKNTLCHMIMNENLMLPHEEHKNMFVKGMT